MTEPYENGPDVKGRGGGVLIPTKAPEGVPVIANADGSTRTAVIVDPTQVRRPWRSTARTIFQAAVALAAMWALIVQALGLPDWAWVSASVAVAGGITRVMALPGVETFLRTFLPFLSAAPKEN